MNPLLNLKVESLYSSIFEVFLCYIVQNKGEIGARMMDDYLDEDLLAGLDAMMEEEEGVLDLFSISSMPEAPDLRSLLACYTKEVLFRLAEMNGFDYRKSWLKARLVDELYAHILATFDERLLFMSDRQFELVRKFMLDEIMMSEENEEVVEFYGEVFPSLIQLGLFFYWESADDFRVFAAREFVEGLEKLAELRANNSEKIEFAQRAEEALKAGINLYGVVNVSRFMDLYAIVDPTFEDTIEDLHYFMRILPVLALWQNFLVVRPLFVASKEFMDEEDVRDFYFALLEKFGEDYYEPRRKEIEYFAEHSFDRTSDVYKALKRLSEKISKIDSDLLMDRMEYHIRLGDSVADALDMFEMMGLIEFSYAKQMERFAKVYSELSNHSRMWVNAGYTPIELRDKFI